MQYVLGDSMTLFHQIINIIFAAGLFINAMLFLPQAWRIYKKRESKELSIVTFLGFWITQLSAIFYGYLNNDKILMWGYVLAATTCGLVTLQIIYYRLKETS